MWQSHEPSLSRSDLGLFRPSYSIAYAYRVKSYRPCQKGKLAASSDETTTRIKMFASLQEAKSYIIHWIRARYDIECLIYNVKQYCGPFPESHCSLKSWWCFTHTIRPTNDGESVTTRLHMNNSSIVFRPVYVFIYLFLRKIRCLFRVAYSVPWTYEKTLAQAIQHPLCVQKEWNPTRVAK